MVQTILRSLLGADPVSWLLQSGEPSAVWVTLRSVMGRGADDVETSRARAEAVAVPAVLALAQGLPMWGEQEDFSGHDSPSFLPNMLNLLADLGLSSGDEPHVDAILDEMLAHQDDQGRFMSFGRAPKTREPGWGALLCDTNAITDLMHRYGRGSDPRVSAALARMLTDIAQTNQGLAWRCVPERRTLFRGPGRKADVCPIVTLQGLRAFSHLPADARPPEVLELARTPLEVWRRRTEERPYQFGHGYQFKSAKWPNLWYDVLYVLETVGRYPGLWQGPDAKEEDAQAVVELAACLIAYNFDSEGRVTPRRAYRGFEQFSFGQKKVPSPFATARAAATLLRVADLATEIAATDVESLASSKGGSGAPVPPRTRRAARPLEPACPEPSLALRHFSREASLRRTIERHHLLHGEAAASVESVTADVVGLRVRSGAAPYLSLLARIPSFTRDRLDTALYDRHGLVRFRAMRGHVFIVRPSALQVLFCATSPEVLRYSRHNLEVRGVQAPEYERLAARILELTAAEPLSTASLRERLDTHADVGAIVTLMCDEGLLLRDRPAGSWRDLRMTYAPLASVLPEVRLGGMTRLEASVELVRAYVRGFGPVTEKDVVWWTGVGAKRVEPALAELGDEIVRVSVEGSDLEHLVHAADVDELELVHARPRHSVAFVPALDPYTMGYAERDRFVADERRAYVMDRAANVAPAILIDGTIAGVWDISEEAEPAVLLHIFEESDPHARDAVLEHARSVGLFWFEREVPVRQVPRLDPLPQRAVGAFMRPLRDA